MHLCIVFTILSGLASLGQADNRAPQDPATKLIDQLSDKDFKVRDRAAKAIEALGPEALPALRKAKDHRDPEVRQRIMLCISELESTLPFLLSEYQRLGLPLPPKKARFVRYDTGVTSHLNEKGETLKDEDGRKLYSLGFELRPATKERSACILSATVPYEPESDLQYRAVNPEPAIVSDLDLGSEESLVLAIQCYARGWDKLAQQLLETSQKKPEENQGIVAVLRERLWPSGTDHSPKMQLLRQAWFYWLGQLTELDTDRAAVAKRLKDLIERDKQFDTEGSRALLRSLELALVPSRAKPGSIESLVDSLVDYQGGSEWIDLPAPEDRYWRIAYLGFGAVPTLIEHLDDERLTRATMGSPFGFPSFNLCVNHVVSDLLEGLAGHQIASDRVRRQQGYSVEKSEAKQWWSQARQVGEEAYLLDHVLRGEKNTVSLHLAHLIEVKYPKHLPSLYRTVLDKHPDMESDLLANVLLRSKVPDKEKLDLLSYAAKHRDYKHRLPALQALKDLDRKQFTKLLLATIESMPEDVPGPYWLCPEKQIAKLAIESADGSVWQLLERVAKRSAVGLRMELLNRFDDPKDTRYKPERLRLLTSFLNDSTPRTIKELSDKGGKPLVPPSRGKFDGPCAGFFYPKLEVRDLVAMEIAHLLGIEVKEKPDRSPEEWSVIRYQIQEALNREMQRSKPGEANRDERRTR